MGPSHCCWEQLPSDILETIIHNYLNIADSIRLSVVCKTWRSIIKEYKIRSRSTVDQVVPWLTLPLARDSKYLRFFDFCEGRFYNINLPKNMQGACCFGSSKGWLVLCKSSLLFHHQWFLFNPISGVQLQLPSMKTIPGFEIHGRHHHHHQVVEFADKFELSSVDAPNCIVAATFNNGTWLGLCRPGDKRWTILEGIDGEVDYYLDILFLNGILYVLVPQEDEEIFTFAFATRCVKVGNVDVVLKLLPDSNYHQPDVTWNRQHESNSVWIGTNILFADYLVESEGDLLMVRKPINIIESRIPVDGNINIENEEEEQEETENDDGDGDGDDDNNDDDGDVEDFENDDDGDGEDDEEEILDYVPISQYHQASRFEVFKIDHSIDDNTMHWIQLNDLGDRILYVTTTGSSSVRATVLNGMKKNCIYFLDDLLTDYSLATSRESGVFYLDDERMERSFPSMNNSIYDRMNWFSPNIIR